MQETWSPIRRFFKLLEIDQKDIYYVYIYAIFAGIITLSLPLGTQAIIGLIAGGAFSASLILLIAVVTLGTIMTGVLRVMQLTVMETIQRRIFTRSAFDFSYRIPRLKQEAINSRYGPELVNRFFDTVNLQKGIPKIIIDFSTAIIQIVFGLVLIAFYHPLFILFGITLLVIIGLIFRLLGPGGLKTSLKESKYKYAVAYWLEELARAVNTFKLSGYSPISLKNTDGLVCNYLESRKKHFRILMTQYGFIVAFQAVIVSSLLALGSYLVINNLINIGQFVAAEIVVLIVLSSAEKLILTLETIYDVLTGLEKLGTVTDLPLEEDKGIDFKDANRDGQMHVEVRNLTFKFPDSDRKTLKNVSFEVKPGERVCIAGYNHSGKSTLLQVVAGLYNQYNGAILYNGIPQRDLNIQKLRQHIGDFSVHESIFKGTIIDNISLGYDHIGLNEVIEAVEAVGLTEFVQSLPDGFHTELLPDGKNIPKSIRTKLILARSIAAKPPLLAVENGLVNLEYGDKEQVAALLTDKEQPWTLVAVSSDPILASQCDKIILLQDGKIITQGSYEEVQNNQHFCNIFKVTPKAVPLVGGN